jgi:DNA topoisomerase-2
MTDLDADRARKYKKMTQLEHVLAKPGMYCGGTQSALLNAWVIRFSAEGEIKMTKEDVECSPAIFKLFDETVTNALDATVKDLSVKSIKITITPTQISCKNDGAGIVVALHPDHPDTYVPSLIFGEMLTSSNYNENEAEAVAGTYGLGIKLCNIFGSRFTAETRDGSTGISFKQEWKDSMSRVGEPKVKAPKGSPKGGFVEVQFSPLLHLLPGGGEITEGIMALFAKRALDIALAVREGVTVTFNGHKLPSSNPRAYGKLFGPMAMLDTSEDGNWTVIVVHAEEGEGDVHGLVNGASSIGEHVNHVAGSIVSGLGPLVKKKRVGHKEVRPRGPRGP